MKSEYTSDGKQHVVHVESGHFSNTEIYELYVKYAVEHADSLGMNEQELSLLANFWLGKVTDVNHGHSLVDQSIESVL